MKRDYLKELGLEEEVIDKIMTEHGKSVQKLKELEGVKEDLEEAKKTIENLEKANKDNESLQKEIESYKEKLENSEKERKAEAKSRMIEDALRGAKGKDLEYLKFKLGDIEVDKDGKLKDIDSKIKELQEKHPSFFETEDGGDTNKGGNGYKPLNNNLNDGKPADKSATIANEFSEALG